jgi:hypothetical protein
MKTPRMSKSAMQLLRGLLVAIIIASCMTAQALRGSANDHLIPVLTGSELRYQVLLAKTLFKTPADMARIVVRPSAPSQGEIAFSIYSTKKNGQVLTIIASARAEKNVRCAASDLDHDLRVDPVVRAQTFELTMPSQVATAVSGAITYAVSGARSLTPTEDVPLDGTSILCFAPALGKGKTASAVLDPVSEGPFSHALRRLVDLLSQYCAPAIATRHALEKQIEAEARKIQTKNVSERSGNMKAVFGRVSSGKKERNCFHELRRDGRSQAL